MASLMHFEIPEKKLIWLASSFDSERSSHEKACVTHWFNCQLEAIIPHGGALDGKATLDGLCASVSESFYYLAEGPLADLISPKFIDAYLRNGTFIGVSHNAPIDSADVVFAAMPGGKLVLVLDKQTYQRFGLVGRPSRFAPGQRFYVEIDTLAPHFVPGKRLYERVLECLTERMRPLKFVCTWTVEGRSAPIEFPASFKSARLPTTAAVTAFDDMRVPVLRADDVPLGGPRALSEDETAHIWAVLDWIGLVACRATSTLKLDARPSPFVSTFSPSLPFDEAQVPSGGVLRRCSSVRCRGLVPAWLVVDWLAQLRRIVQQHRLPYAVLLVNGFKDAPVSWDGNEHSVSDGGGENDQTWIVFGDEHRTYWRCAALDHHDACS